jgi:hypothetical protein
MNDAAVLMEMVHDFANKIAFCMDEKTDEEVESLMNDFEVPDEIWEEVKEAALEACEERVMDETKFELSISKEMYEIFTGETITDEKWETVIENTNVDSFVEDILIDLRDIETDIFDEE